MLNIQLLILPIEQTLSCECVCVSVCEYLSFFPSFHPLLLNKSQERKSFTTKIYFQHFLFFSFPSFSHLDTVGWRWKCTYVFNILKGGSSSTSTERGWSLLLSRQASRCFMLLYTTSTQLCNGNGRLQQKLIFIQHTHIFYWVRRNRCQKSPSSGDLIH